MKTEQNIMCVKLATEYAVYLKLLSHELSLERKKNICVSDLVREALEKTFPMKG